jgi:hypothetical protein
MQGKDRPYLQEKLWRAHITGSETLLHLRTPKFGVRRDVWEYIFWTDRVMWQTDSGNPRKQTLKKYLACINTTAKIPSFTKVPQKYTDIIIVQVNTSRHTNPLFTSPLPVAMYIMNHLYSYAWKTNKCANYSFNLLTFWHRNLAFKF